MSRSIHMCQLAYITKFALSQINIQVSKLIHVYRALFVLYHASFAWSATKLVFVLVLQYVSLKFEIVRVIRTSLLNLSQVTTQFLCTLLKYISKWGEILKCISKWGEILKDISKWGEILKIITKWGEILKYIPILG